MAVRPRIWGAQKTEFCPYKNKQGIFVYENDDFCIAEIRAGFRIRKLGFPYTKIERKRIVTNCTTKHTKPINKLASKNLSIAKYDIQKHVNNLCGAREYIVHIILLGISYTYTKFLSKKSILYLFPTGMIFSLKAPLLHDENLLGVYKKWL